MPRKSHKKVIDSGWNLFHLNRSSSHRTIAIVLSVDHRCKKLPRQPTAVRIPEVPTKKLAISVTHHTKSQTSCRASAEAGFI